MRPHHTKNKGDLGVLYAQLDLARRGYALLLPLTEHAPFDLVAYKDGVFLRVQVKYRTAKAGVITCEFKSTWVDRNAVHVVPIDRDKIDVVCIYNPDTNACYYVDPKRCRGIVCLRIRAPRNNQAKNILWAKDFTDLPASVAGVRAARPPRPAAESLVNHCREPARRWFMSAHSSAG